MPLIGNNQTAAAKRRFKLSKQPPCLSKDTVVSCLAALAGIDFRAGQQVPPKILRISGMKKPIRILHVFQSLDAGGAESRTMEIYRRIDRTKVQFDFLIHTDKKCYFDDEIKSLGGQIFRIQRHGMLSVLNYKKAADEFFRKHRDYRIVHGHLLSSALIYLGAAKKNGIKVRIAHSRNSSRTEISAINIIKELSRKAGRIYATHLFAVSHRAAESAFGRRKTENGAVKVIANAVDAEKYIFDTSAREEMREVLNCKNSLLIGHIGRFALQKNHVFLLEVFKELLKKRKDVKLILIGTGELLSTVRNECEKSEILDNVIFAGVRSDVPKLLQAMDALCFPSFYEGLPGVVLEAQAAGLPCVVSDAITKEVKITEFVEYVSLKEPASFWAEKIVDAIAAKKRENTYRRFIEAGFDIQAVAKWYETFYLASHEN